MPLWKAPPRRAAEAVNPIFTPFCETEVMSALNMSDREYYDAMAEGVLAKSLHFDCRVSERTGCHSFVDVAKYAIFAALAAREEVAPQNLIDDILDEICFLIDIERISFADANADEIESAIQSVFKTSDVTSLSHWRLRRLSNVVASQWITCRRELLSAMNSDAPRYVREVVRFV